MEVRLGVYVGRKAENEIFYAEVPEGEVELILNEYFNKVNWEPETGDAWVGYNQDGAELLTAIIWD